MATWDTVCDIAAALPGAALDSGEVANPAWRVNGRVIVRRNPRLDETVDLGLGEVVAIRVAPDERAALLEQDHETFFLTEHWAGSRNASILVRLSTVTKMQLEELITDAWRVRATKSQQRRS